MVSKPLLLGCLLTACFVVSSTNDEGPDVGSHQASQSAADAMRSFAGSDGAFLAAGLLKKDFKKDDLATLLQYPTNEIVVLSLNGSQIHQAFERSVSLYPQPNESFLQISGFEVTFKKNGTPNNRIITITVNGSKLDESKNYTVAMPSALARYGVLGYYKIWENAKTVKTFDKTTIEAVLRGKHVTETAPRWSAVG